VQDAEFSPDGRHLISGSLDSTLRWWDLERGTAKVLRGHGGAVMAVSFSPDWLPPPEDPEAPQRSRSTAKRL
jgi:WD40 repeat protein